MAHKVVIDKKEYSSRVFDRLEQMRVNDKYCNVTIKAGSEKIQAHQNILCAASDYFDKMLSRDTKENRSGIVEMIDVDEECVKICVDHIYGREISVPPEKYEKLMFVANLMQLHELRDGIIALLDEKLNSKLFFAARRIVDLYGCKNLEKKCVEFAEMNFPLISKEEEFGELSKTYVLKMIKSKKVKITEDEKLDTLLRWADFNPERTKLLAEMLKLIKLDEISVEKHKHLMENDSRISNNLQLFKAFSASLVNIMEESKKNEGAKTSSKSNYEAAIGLFDEKTGFLQRFDLKSNSLTKIHEMKREMKRGRFSAVSLGVCIYVLNWNRLVYRLKYSDKRATWERMSDMIKGHGSWPPAAAFSESIFVVGGSGLDFSCFVEKYDSVTNEWKKLKDKPQSLTRSGILASRGYIYCFGGYSEGDYENSGQRFHLDSAIWEELPPMNEKRAGMGVTQHCGKIYVMGGRNNRRTHLDTNERYDLATQQWTMLRPMRISRRRFRCFSISGCIYAVSGESSSNTLEKYDVEKDEWEMVDIPGKNNLQNWDSVIMKLPTSITIPHGSFELL